LPAHASAAPGYAYEDDDEDDGEGDEFDDRRAGPSGRVRRGRRGRLRPLASFSKPVLAGAALVVVLLLGFVTFLAVGGGDDSNQSPTVTASGRYDPQLRRLFMEECLRSSQGNTAYCTCSLEKLEATYTQAEYIRFNDNVNDAESKRAIREVYQSCRAVE
jgi:hypothetical protein